MTITRPNVETVLISRTGPLLTKAGLDGTTITGTNPDLNDAIGWALRQTDYTVTDIGNVSNADLASVVTADIDKLLDFAELRVLKNILGNISAVDVKLGPRSESLSQLANQIEKKIDRLVKGLQSAYGYSATSLETGLLTYEFAEHIDE